MIQSRLPTDAGVGFRPQHFGDLLKGRQPSGFVDVHAESHMGAGGEPHAQLRALGERYALSVHVAGLSIVAYRLKSRHDPGFTTAIALMTALLLGALAVRQPSLAAGLGVAVAVLDDAALDGTLIGMSFLNRLSKFQVEGGSLLLVQ